jgi:hypothetical protein
MLTSSWEQSICSFVYLTISLSANRIMSESAAHHINRSVRLQINLVLKPWSKKKKKKKNLVLKQALFLVVCIDHSMVVTPNLQYKKGIWHDLEKNSAKH